MIQVLCAFSPQPRQVVTIKLSLPAGSMVFDALRMLHLTPEWLSNSHHFASAQDSLSQQGIWGRLVNIDQQLKDGDRLEIYRALQVDPKLARKQRFKRQGKGRAGLFARRRKGAVAGY
jgi:putative ubiquitin-RnfH superfamily antitoxin RatB of RatAB toxin-antitoxin module